MIDSYHGVCHDKKDLILGQIEACQRLAKYAAQYVRDQIDIQAIENEILVVNNIYIWTKLFPTIGDS